MPSRFLTAGALAVVLAAAGPRPATIDDEMKLRSIVDVRISPDGRRVAYVVSEPSLSKNEHEAKLYVVDVGTGPARETGTGPARDTSAGSVPVPIQIGQTVRIFNTPVPRPQLRWSPDGSMVSVVGFGDRGPQVFGIPVAAGAPRALTAAPEGVFGYEWAPDGKSLAYLTRDPMPPEEARQRQDKSFVIHANAPDRSTRLMVQSLAAGSARTLTPPNHYVDGFSWAPDSGEIAYSAAPHSGFSAPYETRVYAVPSAGALRQAQDDPNASRVGTPRVIVDRAGMNTGPRYSPDGRLIAFISTNGRADIMASRSLTVAPAEKRYGPFSGASVEKGPYPFSEIRTFVMDDAWVNEYVWAPDSRSIYFEANDGTFGRGEHMFEQVIARVSVAEGRAERLGTGPTVAFSISVSHDGRRLAYKSVEARTMGDIAVMDTATGRATMLTDVNPELRDLAVGELKPVKWRSFDGMEIWGLLLTPGAPAGRRLPLLVYVHGGPGGGFTYGLFPQFMHIVPQVDPYPTLTLAGRGFAVLFPMPRGGAGYGEAGQRMIVNAWGEADYQDIMAGVDSLVAGGVADPDRLGVMGASYGGYMTNWIVTQTGRFKAASAGASLTDLTDEYYLSEGGEFMVDYFKRPWENLPSYTAHSPLTHAAKVTTPLLIQHGEVDPRVPIAGAWKWYRALKAMGKTVEFDIYPRGGHVLREPMQQREQMKRNLEWFTRWIRQ